MDHVRPASAELAVKKARTAARLQRPTAEIEDNIDHGRTAFVTADIMALRGGAPIRVNGEVVGAVGVAGLSKETDTDIRHRSGGLEPRRTKPAAQLMASLPAFGCAFVRVQRRHGPCARERLVTHHQASDLRPEH